MFDITISISWLKKCLLYKIFILIDYFHPVSKFGIMCRTTTIPQGQALEVILDIYLIPSKWPIFVFYMKRTDSW